MRPEKEESEPADFRFFWSNENSAPIGHCFLGHQSPGSTVHFVRLGPFRRTFVRINASRPNAEFGRGTGDASGDFTPIRCQEFGKRNV